jgi:hypothetical protein
MSNVVALIFIFVAKPKTKNQTANAAQPQRRRKFFYRGYRGLLIV